jgi:spore photoproduct lyase
LAPVYYWYILKVFVKISQIFIDEQVKDAPIVAEIQSRLGILGKVICDASEVYQAVLRTKDPIQSGKEILFLTRNKGAFIRECPGTRSYTCCGYKILHIGTFCTMDCSYCILQAYFHPPLLQFFVNHEDMVRELSAEFIKPGISRIGTGEFTDSMIWEHATNLSSLLVPLFAAQSRAVLELKTKTTDIQRLKNYSHGRKTICAWSLNTESVIREQERHTASLNSRIRAAATCESWGYPLAFHFDPIALYEGCETEYRNVIRNLFSHVSADNIVWISIGTFRFLPELKGIIQNRFSDSTLIYGEFIRGLDGKMRYFKPLRLRFYQQLVSWIKELAPQVLVYFCMEDDEIWEKSMGFTPDKYAGLSKMLDESAVRLCGLSPDESL